MYVNTAYANATCQTSASGRIILAASLYVYIYMYVYILKIHMHVHIVSPATEGLPPEGSCCRFWAREHV